MSDCQIAQEVNFRLVVTEKDNEDKKRRGVKPNRYEFKFPENWANASKERSIVGLRGLFVMPKYRDVFVGIRVRVFVTNSEAGETEERRELSKTFGYGQYCDYRTRLREFNDSILKEAIKLESETVIIPANSLYALPSGLKMNTDASGHPVDTRFQWGDVIPGGKSRIPVLSRFVFVDNPTGEGKTSQYVFECHYNELPEADRTITDTDPTSGDLSTEIYSIQIEVSRMSDDAKEIFHYESDTRTDKSKTLIFQNVYNYDGCALFSNLDSMSEDGFLANTRRDPIIPIKYYELKNSNQTFWVDTYAAFERDAPVYLNPGDALCIEAQLLTSAKPLL